MAIPMLALPQRAPTPEAALPRSARLPAPAAGPLAIRTDHLTKSYGPLPVVHDLSLDVPSGVIAGFVGPNGAGKTTTIRMLLSLIRPTSGEVEVLGTDVRRSTTYLTQVGALIEGPAFYPALSGKRNLEILARLGGLPAARVPALLEQVGLAGREDDAVKHYSLGMRQRLGIAAALLPDPALLILDEPTNGLDPAGMLEVRQLLNRLKDQGVTILVSSHLLAEVEQLADWIMLLNHGRLVYQGWMEDLLQRQTGTLVVGTAQPQDLAVVAAIARAQHYTSDIVSGLLHIHAPAAYAGVLNQRAMEAGVVLTQIVPERTSLEETFFALTEGGAS